MDGRWDSSIKVSSKPELGSGNAKLCNLRPVLDVQVSSVLEMNIAKADHLCSALKGQSLLHLTVPCQDYASVLVTARSYSTVPEDKPRRFKHGSTGPGGHPDKCAAHDSMCL